MGVKFKAVLLSLISIIMVIGMMGIVYAKTESPVTPQCITEDSLSLKLRDQDEPWKNGVTGTWIANNMAPGEEYAFEGNFVGLKGSSKGKIGITCNYGASKSFQSYGIDTNTLSALLPDKMAKKVIITQALFKNNQWQIDLLTEVPDGMSDKDFRQYHSPGAQWQIQDVDQDGNITFYDLKQAPLSLLPLLVSTPTGETRYTMSVKFSETAGNDLQGEMFNLNMVYTFNQW